MISIDGNDQLIDQLMVIIFKADNQYKEEAAKMQDFLQELFKADDELDKIINRISGYKIEEDKKGNPDRSFSIEASSKYPTLPYTAFPADPEIYLLDKLADSHYMENYDIKITNLKMNSFSSKRRDELFKRFKKEQEEKLIQHKKQVEKNYVFDIGHVKESGEFVLNQANHQANHHVNHSNHVHQVNQGDKKEIFTIKSEDFEKLRPEADLNDTIIDNYLKIVRIMRLDPQVQKNTMFFSSFFLGKLLGDQLRDDLPPEKESEQMIERVRRRVLDSYSSVKRWTRKIDIFTKQYLVIPINAYKHWNCMIILSPNMIEKDPSLCKILYLDSMFEKKAIFPSAIKKYLEIEMLERKGIKVSMEHTKVYQLIVPRQTNTHDCGLYTLCYIEHFLTNTQLLKLDYEQYCNRIQLKIFPRSIIYTMRCCLGKLFLGLLKETNKEKVIEEYFRYRQKMKEESNEEDYDTLNERQFKKYYRINCQNTAEQKLVTEEEMQFQYKIKFYLDCEINHYEKDTVL